MGSYDERGETQHPGAHLVTGTSMTKSALTRQPNHSEENRPPASRRKKLEGMLRRERAKECYQLGLQLNAPSPRAVSELDDKERKKLKKKAIQVSKHGADKRDLLQVMESAEKREERNERARSRPHSRGVQTARSALSGYQSVMERYNNAIEKREEQPEPLVWMHSSEGAMHSKEVFREREREIGIRNDAPLRMDLAGRPVGSAAEGIQRSKGCSTLQAVAMVRERLRAILLQDKQAIRRMFQTFDRDKDGVISGKEFHRALHELGIPVTEQESNKFMQRFLEHRDKYIDFQDFFTKVLGLPHDFVHLPLHGPGAKSILKPENPTEKMRMSIPEAEKWFLAQVRLQVLNVPHCLGRVFAVMDPDHSGSIDTEELREGLRKIGLWLKEDELRQLFQIYDEDQSGEIDYKEFIAEILGIPSMAGVKKGMAGVAAKRLNTSRTARTNDTTTSSQASEPVKGTIRARELQQIIRQKLERAIADPGHLRNIFGRLDRDGSGVLTYDDFAVACEGFGIMLDAEAKGILFERFDVGHQGYITYADFVNRVALVPHDIVDIPHPHAPEARCSTPQVLDEVRDRLKEGVLASRPRIEALFKWFDKGNTKKISYGAFRDQLRALQLPIQDHHIKNLWKEFGAQDKGSMNFADFVEKVLDFQLDGLPVSSSVLCGTPVDAPIPNGSMRPKPVFDLGRTRVLTGDPKTKRGSRPASPAINLSPFGATGIPGNVRRPGTANSVMQRGKRQSLGNGLPKAPTSVDIFAQADNELTQMHARKEARRPVDRSFRGDNNYSRPSTGRSWGRQSQASEGSRWESSRSIK